MSRGERPECPSSQADVCPSRQTDGRMDGQTGEQKGLFRQDSGSLSRVLSLPTSVEDTEDDSGGSDLPKVTQS